MLNIFIAIYQSTHAARWWVLKNRPWAIKAISALQKNSQTGEHLFSYFFDSGVLCVYIINP